MHTRQLLAIVVASAITAAGVGFGMAQATQPEAATAAKASGSKQIVRAVNKLGRTLKSSDQKLEGLRSDVQAVARDEAASLTELQEVNDALGTTFLKDDALRALDKIRDHVYETCRVLDGSCFGR